ncbi:hypothetical protein HanIR_Chr13g0659391 [Helianthus annuus]|nr:hypothetical protein HanIR_Chr13g0659391 [Helianthus annuus]
MKGSFFEISKIRILCIQGVYVFHCYPNFWQQLGGDLGILTLNSRGVSVS